MTDNQQIVISTAPELAAPPRPRSRLKFPTTSETQEIFPDIPTLQVLLSFTQNLFHKMTSFETILTNRNPKDIQQFHSLETYVSQRCQHSARIRLCQAPSQQVIHHWSPGTQPLNSRQAVLHCRCANHIAMACIFVSIKMCITKTSMVMYQFSDSNRLSHSRQQKGIHHPIFCCNVILQIRGYHPVACKAGCR